MLADPTALLAKDLDTYNEADGVAERGDFIVSRRQGRGLRGHLLQRGPQRRGAAAPRAGSQFVYEHGDQVCPANWTPGEETIEPSLDLVGQL